MQSCAGFFLLAALLTLAGPSFAQSLNVDVGDTTSVGIPSNAYGAAAGQPGHWNAVSGGYPYQFTLNDLAGVPTSVMTNASNNGTGSGDFFFNNSLTSGDDEKLMDDLEDVGGGTSATTWTFSGLLDGAYDVYTYAWGPDNSTFVSSVTPNGSSDTQNVGGIWPGGHAMGTTYALHCVTVSGGSDVVIVVQAVSGFGSVNGFQFKMKAQACPPDVPGTPYCDCTSTSPCGNTGAPGNGCANGSNPNGANLAGSGIADVTADTVVLHGTGAVPFQPGLFFQGNNKVNGGNGILFGDGLRCAGMNVVRLQVVNADAAGDMDTSVSISVKGGVNAGDIKHYQLWYRDPQGTLCGSTFNLSNGYTINWF